MEVTDDVKEPSPLPDSIKVRLVALPLLPHPSSLLLPHFCLDLLVSYKNNFVDWQSSFLHPQNTRGNITESMNNIVLLKK